MLHDILRSCALSFLTYPIGTYDGEEYGAFVEWWRQGEKKEAPGDKRVSILLTVPQQSRTDLE